MGHKQAVEKIKVWYLTRLRVTERNVRGTEPFTLFYKMTQKKQEKITEKINLHPLEIPVLLFTIRAGEYIINTSERFVKITPTKHESVYYDEFESFIYYSPLRWEEEPHKSKEKKSQLAKPKLYIELGLKKTSKEIIIWKIPKGDDLHSFWNVTRSADTIRIEST
ncbi:hypothetical protein SAMN05518672_1011604 [Chitinophaga sp. CF118]|nr:hypothetical protein SAMN05518672_1011604 [Chitinophaga sp. CF118]